MQQLRLARLRRGLSQAALAERAGVRPSTILRLEHATTQPRPSTLGWLSTALDCTVDALLTPDELAAVGTRPPARPALRCALDCGAPIAAAEVWHYHLPGADPDSPPPGAHLDCLQRAQGQAALDARPTYAPCCRKNGTCAQRWG